MHAALRETKEEVGIDADKVQILGRLGPPMRSMSGLRVWPYVVSIKHHTRISTKDITSEKAFLHEHPYDPRSNEDDTSPLLSPPLSSLTLSQAEVATVFHLPLSRLTNPHYLREHRFYGSGSSSYWACDVTDLVAPGIEWSNAGANFRNEVGGQSDGRLEIWGLTGWYLNLLLKVLLTGHRH